MLIILNLYAGLPFCHNFTKYLFIESCSQCKAIVLRRFYVFIRHCTNNSPTISLPKTYGTNNFYQLSVYICQSMRMQYDKLVIFILSIPSIPIIALELWLRAWSMKRLTSLPGRKVGLLFVQFWQAYYREIESCCIVSVNFITITQRHTFLRIQNR